MQRHERHEILRGAAIFTETLRDLNHEDLYGQGRRYSEAVGIDRC
jgi:hypothetical protein